MPTINANNHDDTNNKNVKINLKNLQTRYAGSSKPAVVVYTTGVLLMQKKSSPARFYSFTNDAEP